MANNLITVDEFKTYKIINSESDDEVISSLIVQVSAFIKAYCNRTFVDYYKAANAKIEYFNGTLFDREFLAEIPVVAVSDVSVSDDNGQTYTSLVEYTDYVVDLQNDLVLTLDTSGYFTTTANSFNSLRVTYTGGFVTTPPDIKLAAMDLVQYYRGKEYVTRKTLAGAQEDNSGLIIQKGAPLPYHIKRVLDMHRVF